MDPQKNASQTEPHVVSSAPTVPPVVPAPVVQMPGTPTVTALNPEMSPVPMTPESPKKLNIPKIDPKNIPGMLKKMPLKFKILAGFVSLLVVLLILASFTKQGKKVTQLILPSPSPIPASSPVGEVLTPTKYATDPEILDIEKALVTFDSKLAGTDLKEDSLRVPNLDYAVDFSKQ